MCCRAHAFASAARPKSTQARPKRGSPNALGIAGFVVSLVGLVFTFGLLCPLGLLLSFFGLFSRNRGFAVAGLVLGIIGSSIVALGVGAIALAASAAHHHQVEIPRQEKTYEILNIACIEIEAYRQEEGRLPEGIEGNKLVLRFEDAYGNAVRYEPEDNGQYAIRSAGPDEQFDTPDDLRVLSRGGRR